ncbi:MAG: transglutaminase family protein [Eubacteriales bacterium]
MNLSSDKKMRPNPFKKNRQKSAAETLQQKIDTAEKKRSRIRVENMPEAVTVSPASGMTAVYTAIGFFLRALTLFVGVFGLNLFLFDAIQLIILNGARAENITVSTSFVLLWSIAVTVYTMLLSLHRISRTLSPFITVGIAAAYIFGQYSDPIGYMTEAFRRFADLIFENMGAAGYTTYMQYISTEGYSYSEEALVSFAAASIIVVSGLLLGLFTAKRVHAVGVAAICAVYMIPVFMFNITRTNKGLATLLVFICGVVALYLYDCLYGGVFAKKKAAKKAKKSAKAEKKEAKKAAKTAKINLKNSATLAYNTSLESGMPRSAAKKAKAAVLAKAEKERKERIQAEKKAKTDAKIAAVEAKKAEKESRKAAKLAAREESKKLKARAAAARKSNNPETLAALSQAKADAKKSAKEAKKLKNAPKTAELKTRAASGYAGGMAMLIAVLAIWIPLVAISKNFPIIDVINNKMQLARTYVTAYLMGDDVDLNSLAMYGGVAELNPRNVDFNTPQYTGQKLFSVEVSYQAPVYMRSWIGSDYDLETDHWSSADSEEVIAYRSRFGSAYSPDNITYFFNKYVYPNALDVQKVDQYRNLDEFGFRVFQVHVTRVSGNSRILFVPSIMNAGLGIMERGSIEPVSMKYSAYYDGIYSSRFFNEGSEYSVSSFNPVMKDPDLAVNLEGSIEYYNVCKKYADTIDQIESEINSNLLFKEDKEYTYETALGEITMTGRDLTFLCDMFEEEIASFGYRYKAQSFVEMYLQMTAGERRQYMNAYASELNYRDYAEETYTETFGSEKISALAKEILAENGIVMGDKPVHDKSYLETKSETQIKRMTAEEKYGNYYESWFYDAETGETVPRHEAILAVINYLRYNYTYTLDPNCPQTELLDEDGNVVLDEAGNPVMVDLITADSNLEAFLFDIKEGYCVHFATSAVALLRELGFAVRYDEGYIASGFSRTYAKEAVSTYRTSVRDYDAHAWVEVYYPAMGWITYECTPSYCEIMYDLENTSESTSSGIDQSKVTVRDEIPEMSETIDTVFGTEDEPDYTALFIVIGVVLAVVIALTVVWAVMKKRAMKAVESRLKLVDESRNEQKYSDGETDIHSSARAITDCIFDILSALGMPPETGELPSEYALRVDAEYSDISRHKITDVMGIIEKEEFGGQLTFRELCTLAEYLSEIQSSVYSSLPAAEKLRMRYIMNVI